VGALCRSRARPLTLCFSLRVAWQNGGGWFRIEYYLLSYSVVVSVSRCAAVCVFSLLCAEGAGVLWVGVAADFIAGLYMMVVGRMSELMFVMATFVLSLSAWAYLMGTISGEPSESYGKFECSVSGLELARPCSRT
jgi:hypothetical protein